mmetsp:Transcript_17953/g.15866  ORF Transcript_17953/g.15866 Transcript_17953/m.15866 type:complete len:87 (+) Transcript_17953:197-457(+)
MFFDRNGSPWITIGPDFGFTMCLFIFVGTLYSILLYFLFQIKDINPLFRYAGVTLVAVNASAVLITVFLNPGHPTKERSVRPGSEW